MNMDLPHQTRIRQFLLIKCSEEQTARRWEILNFAQNYFNLGIYRATHGESPVFPASDTFPNNCLDLGINFAKSNGEDFKAYQEKLESYALNQLWSIENNK